MPAKRNNNLKYRRMPYYICFHDMEINECKEVALYAYWILKLRPFVITDTAYLRDPDACYINESYSRFLEYSFRFRNFSIDSFIVLVESISTETLEKEFPNLYDQPDRKRKP